MFIAKFGLAFIKFLPLRAALLAAIGACVVSGSGYAGTGARQSFPLGQHVGSGASNTACTVNAFDVKLASLRSSFLGGLSNGPHGGAANLSFAAAATPVSAGGVVTVSLPIQNAFPGSSITIPATTSDTTGQGIIAFQFDLIYDPAVITPDAMPIDTTGTISSGMSVTTNVPSPGLLKASFFTSVPRSGAGTLFNFKFTAVGPVGSQSALTWQNFFFNEGDPGDVTTNGQVTIVGLPPNTPSVSNSPHTFTGNPITIAVTCSGGGTATNITPATATNVGSYPVTASCPATAGFSATTNAPAGNFVINPAASNTPSVSNSPQTFTGNPITIEVTCSGGGTATNITPASATNVGTYAVTASCPAVGNLGASTNAAAGNFVINPATFNTPSVNNSPQTFTGNPITIAVTCSAGGTATNIQPPTATNVGTYAVTANCPAVGNVGASTNAAAGNFVINPATFNTPSVSNSPQTFTGNPITIAVTCSAGGSATNITPATATNVGSVPVTANCPAVGNVGASTNAAAGNFVINPATFNTPSVSNSPQAFTGNPITIAVTCSAGGTATNIQPPSQTNVGTYAVTASCPAVGNVGASTNAPAGNFLINPATFNTPSVSNSPQVFTGNPITIAVTCSAGGTATNIQPATATNVGTYAVTASCPAVGNVGASTNAAAGNFVINPANSNLPSVSNSPQMFTGNPITIAVTCSGGGTATNIQPATATNVGTYAVTANCPAVGNLAASANAAAGNFVINPATFNTPSVSNSPQMFTGNPITIAVTCSAGGTATNIQPGTATNVGTYAVTANCPAVGNVGASTNASAGNFVINPAPNTPLVSNSPQTFTGNPITIAVTCAGGGAATNITPATATNVGSTPVTASCPAVGNFSATTNASAGNFVINPAANRPAVSNSPQTFTGNPITIAVTCAGGGAATNITPATATNVGSYPVTASCPAVGNFSATTNASAGNFVINPAPNTPSVSNSPQTFTGNPITIAVTCAGGGTATNITPATATNVGSYPVTASCPAVGNFSATTNASAGNFIITGPNTFLLTVFKAGNGTGTVTSAPAGINCGADCSDSYSGGTMVTLSAAPSNGSVFTGWTGGGCAGTGTCMVTVNGDTNVTATFTFTPTPTPTPVQAGFEADLAGRFTGDGNYRANDVQVALDFFAGVPMNGAFNEFQRADSAPYETKGDGRFDATDVQQLKNYVAVLSAPQTAGGPIGPIAARPTLERSSDEDAKKQALRTLRILPATAEGDKVTAYVVFDPHGDEVAVSFSLKFDPTILSNPKVELGDGASEGTNLTTNTTETANGWISVLLDAGIPAELSASKLMVSITFDVAPNAQEGETRLSFDGSGTFSNMAARRLPATYEDGVIYIKTGPAAISNTGFRRQLPYITADMGAAGRSLFR